MCFVLLISARFSPVSIYSILFWRFNFSASIHFVHIVFFSSLDLAGLPVILWSSYFSRRDFVIFVVVLVLTSTSFSFHFLFLFHYNRCSRSSYYCPAVVIVAALGILHPLLVLLYFVHAITVIFCIRYVAIARFILVFIHVLSCVHVIFCPLVWEKEEQQLTALIRTRNKYNYL